jgi:recombination protein RecA
MYNEGISREGDLIDIGTQMGLIAKRGAFFSFGETRIGQGRENAKQYLKEHPDLAAQIEQAIREQILSNREAMKFGASSDEEGKVEEEAT